MKKVLLAGKLNEPMKDLHTFLSGHFTVQLCPEDAEVFSGMMKVVRPDIVLVSLIGLYEVNAAIFRRMETDYPEIPVITIGTEAEREALKSHFEGEQFENLIRPLENSTVYEAVCRRLSVTAALEEPEKDKRPNILIVDDNAATLRAIKAMLEDRYEVTAAISGMKAMNAIGKRRPDLILLDYEMPVCDGKQTLEMIRNDDEISMIPVIFLTGVNDREHIQAVLNLKPAGYLLKPPVKETLLEAIEKGLS